MAMLAGAALLFGAGCTDPYSSGVDGGGGDGGQADLACVAGEGRCKGNVWQECTAGGKLEEQDCGDGVCIEGLGCRLCAPSTRYCVGQDVYQCNDEGTAETKLETCPEDQECLLGKCSDLCDKPMEDRSNVGCEFWAVDLPNEYACQSMDSGQTCGMMYLCAACQQFAVAIANTSTFKARVKVEINEAPPGDPLQLKLVADKEVPAGSLGLINLPMREVDCTEWYTDATGKLRRKNDSTSCLSSRAFRIKSTVPVVAYQFNPIINDFSNGASLLIPKNGLDNEYRVLGWSTANPIAMDIFPPDAPMRIEGIPDYMNVTVVGTEENTAVEVTVTHKTQGSPDGVVTAATPGDTVTATLGPFDVLNLNTIQDFANPTGDLSGTLVKASAPVVVFSGGARALVPGFSLDSYNPKPPEPSGEYDVCCTEHFEQQLFPVSSLGIKFAITRSPVRTKPTLPPEPDFYRVLATVDQTIVRTNLPDFPLLPLAKAGQLANFWATGPFTVEADKPIMIAQYTVCQGFLEEYLPGHGGDPEFVIFPPVEQHRAEYIFLTPPTFTSDFVVVAAPESALIRLDGTLVSGEFNTECVQTRIGPIDSENYVEYRCPVADGVHRLESSRPVGITAYGYYNVGSYGYPGGADVRKINIR